VVLLTDVAAYTAESVGLFSLLSLLFVQQEPSAKYGHFLERVLECRRHQIIRIAFIRLKKEVLGWVEPAINDFYSQFISNYAH